MTAPHDEIRSVLARAAEIEQAEALGQSDIARLMLAADEAGISRAALERALRERMALPMQPPSVGQLVFARSTDERYYVAEVRGVSPAGYAVHFLRGGDLVARLDDLKPCSFLPGERVTVEWPWWGPWTCIVVSYDAEHRLVALSDGWGDMREFRISEVWLAPPKTGTARRAQMVNIMAIAAAVGAAAGSLLTFLLLR